jgi:hypothetical protein
MKVILFFLSESAVLQCMYTTRVYAQFARSTLCPPNSEFNFET